jgi:hypothetical protein
MAPYGAARYNRAMRERKNKNDEGRSGQAMLVTVLTLGGAILGATTIAGLLMLYQIRATTDSENSAKAIFAADAGTDWARFSYYCGLSVPSRCPNGIPAQPAQPAFAGSGAVASTTCYSDAAATQPSSCASTSTVAAIATGISLNSERAFYLGFSSAITPYP